MAGSGKMEDSNLASNCPSTDVRPDAAAGPAEIPAAIRAILVRHYRSDPEAVRAYEQYMAMLGEALEAKGLLEWTWVKTMTDLHFDAERAKRAIEVKLKMARHYSLKSLYELGAPTGDRHNPGERNMMSENNAVVVRNMIAGWRSDAALFRRAVAKFDINEDHWNDVAYVDSLDVVERLTVQADQAMSRFNAAVRELERKRDAESQRKLKALAKMADYVDVDFTEANTPENPIQ